MRHTNKLLIILSFLFITILISCNFDIISKKKGQVFFDFSSVANQLKPNSRSVLDSIIDPETEYFIDLKIDGSYKLNTTIDLSQQTYYEITDIPAGTRIKASIEVYSWNMNLFPHTKNILFTGESKSCVISSGENTIEIKLKANFKITFKIYVRYNADYQNNNWENEPSENDGLTKDTGFYYIQSAINWITANGNNKKNYEIVLTGHDNNQAFNQYIEFDNNLNGKAKSITLSSDDTRYIALKSSSIQSIEVKMTGYNCVPLIFRDILISTDASNESAQSALILQTVQYCNCDITLDEGTKFIGDENHKSARGSAILLKGGIVTMKSNSIISGFHSRDEGGAVFVEYGTFNMTDSAVIENCHSEDGGAIYLTNINNSFNINKNATIKNCSASRYGGAIFQKCENINIEGGSIINCSANYCGGAVYMDTSSNDVNLLLSGGEIKNNEAPQGSAFYLSKDRYYDSEKFEFVNKYSKLIMSENACVDLSNDIFCSELQPVYLSGTLKTNNAKAALLTYVNGADLTDNEVLVANDGKTNISKSYSKFYVREAEGSSEVKNWYINQQGKVQEFSIFLTSADEVQLGDIVFADNRRTRASNYPYLDYELYSSIAGIIFYVGSDTGFLKNINLIVGTETYEGHIESNYYSTNSAYGYAYFNTINIESFPYYSNNYSDDSIYKMNSVKPLNEIADADFKNRFSNVNTPLTGNVRFDQTFSGDTYFNKIINTTSFPLHKKAIEYGNKFNTTSKYTINSTTQTDNWFIPTIAEYKLLADALNNSTFKKLYQQITNSLLTGNYISSTIMWNSNESSQYPAVFKTYLHQEYWPYYFGINFETKTVLQLVSPPYNYWGEKAVPIHLYEPGD